MVFTAASMGTWHLHNLHNLHYVLIKWNSIWR